MTRFRRKSAALNLVRIIPVWHVDLRMRIAFASDLRPSRAIFLADKPIGKEMARSRDIYASPFV